ncbi:MAG: YicC family protein [Acidobacteriota bacterium]|nr:YicC family protein [Acidobacteriota bacterium]MDH3785030.1 YicC family protein [Acidobacteriota bacterium]
MIRSMTGYGRGSAEMTGYRMTVEIRSVNHRFADLRFRLPAEMGRLETVFRRQVAKRVHRGRVEVQLRFEAADGQSEQRFNRPLFDEVLGTWKSLAAETGANATPDLAAILRISSMFRADGMDRTLDEEQASTAGVALDQALGALDEDRRREGESLRDDLLLRVATLAEAAGRAGVRVSGLPDRLKVRLEERLAQLATQVELDPGRVAQEAAILAERSDVSEELVRLEGHLQQAERLLRSEDGKPVGKRLDFLVQEIHREVNTVGSKSQDLDLTRITLEMKSETEKIREQVQNLE